MKRRNLTGANVREEVGHAADATNETMPFHIWAAEVERTTRAFGVDPYSLRRGTPMRAKMHAGYNIGEPVWMMADTLIGFAEGARAAAEEPPDDREAIKRAYRASRGTSGLARGLGLWHPRR